MGGCCSSSGADVKHPKKRRCPINGAECLEVPTRTITHHIKEPWNWMPTAERFYFCDTPDCDAVYFGDDDSVVFKSMLRTQVGAKGRDGDSLLCHCFGVSRADLDRDPSVRDFVVEQTKAGRCSCETSNPSGRCCLKGFPKPKG
ncbi:MAG: putative iron-sulfur cluster-binding metallochaperone [Rhodocyclaceae bacterium]